MTRRARRAQRKHNGPQAQNRAATTADGRVELTRHQPRQQLQRAVDPRTTALALTRTVDPRTTATRNSKRTPGPLLFNCAASKQQVDPRTTCALQWTVDPWTTAIHSSERTPGPLPLYK